MSSQESGTGARGAGGAAAAKALRERQASIAQQVAALQLQARRLAAGVLAGLHRSVFRGGSAEFAEYKEYSPGDDPRTIDWKSVARSDRWFVKRFEETTNRRCWLLLDRSSSMAFSRGGRPSKLDAARLSLATLATILLRQGDAVGAAVLSNAPSGRGRGRDGRTAAGTPMEAGADAAGVVPPKSRVSHLEAVLTRLVDADASGTLATAPALDALAPVLGRRSLVVLASDLVDDVDAVAASLRRLAARGHEVVVLQVLDRDEIDFPFEGMLRFRDPETGEEVTADAPAIREGYRREVAAFLAACDAAASGAQGDVVRTTTDEDPARALLRFLARRRALARRVARAG